MLESYVTTMGNLIARANITSPSYGQAGTYTCQAENPGRRSATITSRSTTSRSIEVTITCRKLNFSE